MINLNRRIDSTQKLAALQGSKPETAETLSATDRYDLKAYQFNQYFPQPEPGRTE